MARARDGMPVVMRSRMNLTCKPCSDGYTDEQKNDYLPGFVGDK